MKTINLLKIRVARHRPINLPVDSLIWKDIK